MAIVVDVNGRICDAGEAAISVLDHGFLYGEGIYEVIRTYNKRPFLLDRHLQRLRRSGDMITLPLPGSERELEERIVGLLTAFFEHPDNRRVAEAYVRLLVTRGVGELNYETGPCVRPSLVIIAKALNGWPSDVYEKGVKVAMVSVLRNHPCSINPLIKSNNLLNNALAAQEAHRKGAFEAVMHNYRGEIAECSTANLFVVSDGVVWTPPLDAGLLSGITRGFVLELCKSEGIEVGQRTLRDEDLFHSDESFFTSSTKEVVPVVQVDDRAIGDGRPGPTTRRLLAAYRRKAMEMTAS
jgi:branched-chain amino acid aminotransferase